MLRNRRSSLSAGEWLGEGFRDCLMSKINTAPSKSKPPRKRMATPTSRGRSALPEPDSGVTMDPDGATGETAASGVDPAATAGVAVCAPPR